MSEAEDVITDAARHATVFIQDLWRRHRPPQEPRTVRLVDVARRLELLLRAVFGTSFRLRPARLPPRPSTLERLFRRIPRHTHAIPATDGVTLWLPPDSGLEDEAAGVELYRLLALQQGMRATRGTPALSSTDASPLVRDLALVFEARLADEELSRLLPGLASSLQRFRRSCLTGRPPASGVEFVVQDVMKGPAPSWTSPADSLEQARVIAAKHPKGALLKDLWIGEVFAPPPRPLPAPGLVHADEPPVRSARLPRRPRVREADDDEDDREPGVWMVQTSQPHEHAEDPMGLQRPTDRDEQNAADEHADSLSELPQARLVSSPQRPKEVLVSDDPPDARSRHAAVKTADETSIRYPEWDFRVDAYRPEGATVRLRPATEGAQAWVDRMLVEHRPLLVAVRRQFESLRGERTRLRRQLEGDDLDLAACVEARADLRAGHPPGQGLYEQVRAARRSLALSLLVDVSGSTDGWLSAHRRIVDVEREALLVVAHALEALGEPYAIHAFSGRGPASVVVRGVKRFDERHGGEVSRRIAGLEPEDSTRAGAALRHVTSLLMRQPAHHRLLLLLSDGRPNDVDEYEGRYGLEDVRQAVNEARLQGIQPFCFTVDRHAAGYLPRVFGAGQYALLTEPARLPLVLVDWVRRLVAG